MKYLILIWGGFILGLCSCKQNQSDKTHIESSITTEEDSIKTEKRSPIFDQYESWLLELKDTKHKELYLDILKKIHETPNNCKDKAIADLSDKEIFLKIFNEFQFFNFEDKSIAIRGFNTWSAENLGTIFALVDKRDSIISFKYKCISLEALPGGGKLDTIYMADWNKNGSSDLMTKEFDRILGYRNYNMVIYDLKVSENEFDPLFSYTESRVAQTEIRSIHEEWKDTLRFISPEIIEKTSLNWYVVDTLHRKNDEDEETFKKKVEAQNNWLKELEQKGKQLNSAKKSIYKFDKQAKTFFLKNE